MEQSRRASPNQGFFLVKSWKEKYLTNEKQAMWMPKLREKFIEKMHAKHEGIYVNGAI